MKIFFIICIMFFAPFFAAVAIVDELVYIDGSKFLSFLNTAKTENQARINDAIMNEQADRYYFHMGMDVAFGDVLEHLRDD
jgi:hypothetical protein